MTNIIATVLLIAVFGSACYYIRKEKKKGKCIGCPMSGCSSCHCHGDHVHDEKDKTTQGR